MLAVSSIIIWFRHGSCIQFAGTRHGIVQSLDLRELVRDVCDGCAVWIPGDGKVREVTQLLKAGKVARTIVALRERLETVCQTELERMRRRDIKFGSEQQGAIEELTRGIVATIVQGPATVLEAASTEIETAAVLRMVHCIFDLECD